MSKGLTNRVERLTRRLKARTRANGDPKPGYEQNCAVIRAELDMITKSVTEKNDNGE
jgi:hypothetical protein